MLFNLTQSVIKISQLLINTCHKPLEHQLLPACSLQRNKWFRIFHPLKRNELDLSLLEVIPNPWRIDCRIQPLRKRLSNQHQMPQVYMRGAKRCPMPYNALTAIASSQRKLVPGTSPIARKRRNSSVSKTRHPRPSSKNLHLPWLLLVRTCKAKRANRKSKLRLELDQFRRLLNSQRLRENLWEISCLLNQRLFKQMKMKRSKEGHLKSQVPMSQFRS